MDIRESVWKGRKTHFFQIRRILILMVLYFVVSGLVLNFTFFYTKFHSFSEATFSDMVEGKAHRPYVYRALLPLIIRYSNEAIPSSVRSWLKNEALKHDLIKRYFNAMGWSQDSVVEYGVAVVLWLLCYIGFCFAFRQLFQYFYPSFEFVSEFSPIVVPCFIITPE